MAEEKVPVELARLWRLPTGSKLGRPAGLDVEQVVRAAVELADRDGLDGVTLLKVAQALDVTKMSLYRHVGSKDELFDLMGDYANDSAPDLTAGDGWRAGMTEWARALRANYQRRPWMVDLPVSGPPGGPNAIAWMDAALRALSGTGLDWGTKVGILNVLSGYVRHSSVLSQQMARSREASGRDQTQVEQDYGRALAGLVDPARFPEVAAMFASPVFENPVADPDESDFAFGLNLVLDGIAATIP